MRLSFVLSLLLALTTFSPQGMAAERVDHKGPYPGCSTQQDCKCYDCTWSEKQQCCFSNPAAGKCVKDGGWYFETQDGQTGRGNYNLAVCYFEDKGEACSAWFYVRGLCKKGNGVKMKHKPKLEPGSTHATITPDDYCNLQLGTVADAGKECKNFRPSEDDPQRRTCTVDDLWKSGITCKQIPQ